MNKMNWRDNEIVVEHMAWLKANPNFNKSIYDDYASVVLDCYECADRICQARHEKNELGVYDTAKFNKIVTQWYESDIKEKNKIDNISLKIKARTKKIFDEVNGVEEKFAFITIGYNEQTITPALMRDCAKKVSEMRYWNTCTFVHEKHCSNGIHHHTHFLVTYSEDMYKTKIVQFIWQLAGMKKVVLGPTFIDVKGSADKNSRFRKMCDFQKYIDGDKTHDKMECVALDALWRKENNL